MMILSAADFFEMNARYTALKNRFYAVFLFKEGKGTIGIDNREFEVAAGRIVFINYHQVYYFREFSAEGHVLMFTKSFYNHVYTGNRLIRSDRILTDVPAFSDIKNASGKNLLKSLELLQREFLENHPVSKEILCLELKVFVLQYLKNAGTDGISNLSGHHKKQLAEQFSELVHMHYKEFRTTAPYAEMLHITANYLNAVVKEHSGFTAGRVIRNRVILEAERLLMHTAMSITEISYELGFQDNSHFGKYFKAAEGISPQRYRTEKSRPDIF